jgi:hypothetical protein
MKTLLQIIQDTCDELALSRPSVVISTTDPQVRQMTALLNRLGRDIVKQYEWQKLDKEYLVTTVQYTYTGTITAGSKVITGLSSTTGLTHQFTVLGEGIMPFAQIVTVDNPTQVTMDMAATQSGTVSLQFTQNEYTLPEDWDREVPQTEWNRTTRWPLLGPKSAQEWQTFKSGIVSAGPRQRFRILGNSLTINPSPPPGQMVSYEYISNAWVIGADGTYKTAFTADTDKNVFGDSLMITGLKTQWKQAKGLDFTFDLGEFRTLLEQAKAQDKSAAKMYLSQASGNILLTNRNIIDGSFPSQ